MPWKETEETKSKNASMDFKTPSLQLKEKVKISVKLFPINKNYGSQFQVSRAQILKKAADYIQFIRWENAANQQDIADLQHQNKCLKNQSK